MFALLSDDLICYILSFLDSTELCRGPALTCRRFFGICHESAMWNSVTVSGGLSDSSLFGLCSVIGSKVPRYDIRSLSLHSKFISAPGFSNAMWNIPHVVQDLQRLDLSGCSSLDQRLLKWIRGCRQLRELRLSGCQALVSNVSIFQACSSFYNLEPIISRLEVLDMRDVLVPLQVFSKLSAPHLRTLMISAYPVIEPDETAPFFLGFPSLENIHIYGGKSSGFFPLAALGLLSSLRVLDIPGFPVHLSESESLSVSFPNLQVLKMRATLAKASSASSIADLQSLEELSFVQKRNHIQIMQLDLSRCKSLRSAHLSLKVLCEPRDFGLGNLPVVSDVKLGGHYDMQAVCTSLKRSETVRHVEFLVRNPQERSYLKSLEHTRSLVVVEKYHERNASALTPSPPPSSPRPVVAVPQELKVGVEGSSSKLELYMHRHGSSFRDLLEGSCTGEHMYRHQALFRFKDREMTDMLTARDLGLQTSEIKLSCRLL